DRIVMMALRKEPDRRYRSAQELGEDIDRWLAGHPVRAVPDAPMYRMRKLVRRHRTALAVTASVAVLLVASVVGALWQARTIADQRDAAIAAREDADRAAAMLVDLFAAADPTIHPGGDSLRVDDLVARAEAELSSSMESPRIQARLWRTLAGVHGARSRYDEQEAALARACEAATTAEMTDEVLAIQHEQARLVLLREGRAAAEPLLRESLERHLRRYGPDASDVAIAAQDLASVVEDPEEQRRLLERALAITRAGLARGQHDDSLSLASALNGLGTFYWQHGDQARAVGAFTETQSLLARMLSPDHPHVLVVRSNLAVGLEAVGRFDEAEAMHREILAARRRVLGDESGEVAGSLLNVGHCLVHEGRYEDAIPYLEESVRIARLVYGAAHPMPARGAVDLAIAMVRAGRIDAGFRTFDDAEALLLANDGSAANRCDLAARRTWLALWAGRPVTADDLRACRDPEDAAAAMDPVARAGIERLRGVVALVSGDGALAEAEDAFRTAIELLEGKVAEQHPSLAMARCGLEIARAGSGRPFDRRVLAAALPRCESWGLGDAAMMRRGHALLES
ncbi:MAG: tetratricopeptide repeat protein, partial [Phycisphaerales bacterium]|nr:tetratricopeptide repeat protein [Phycisphaerales bacterium]